MTAPRIEDYLRTRGFERRAHILTPNGEYRIRSSLGHVAQAGVLDRVLPDYSSTGTLMWVDFLRHTQIDVSPEGKPTVKSCVVGDTGIATGPQNIFSLEEVLEEDIVTDYLEDWLRRYCGDRTRGSFNELRHPIVAPVALLRAHIKNRSQVK